MGGFVKLQIHHYLVFGLFHFLLHTKYMRIYPVWNLSETYMLPEDKRNQHPFKSINLPMFKLNDRTTITILYPFRELFLQKQSMSSKAKVSFRLKCLELLSAEGELLLDKARPDVLGDREVRLPGRENKMNMCWYPISDILGSTYADIRYPIFNIRYPGKKTRLTCAQRKLKQKQRETSGL